MWGDKARLLRKKHGLHQKDVALRAGFAQSSASGYEQATYPELKYIAALCEMAGIELWEFFMNDTQKADLMKVPVEFLRVCDALRSIQDDSDRDMLLDLILRQVAAFSGRRHTQK